MKINSIVLSILCGLSINQSIQAHEGRNRKSDARRSNMRLKHVADRYCQSVGTDSDSCKSAHDKVKDFKNQIGDGADGYIKSVRDYTKELQDLIHSSSSESESSENSGDTAV